MENPLERLERIREEVTRTRDQTWWGDYPVEDVMFLVALVDELLLTHGLHPQEDDD